MSIATCVLEAPKASGGFGHVPTVLQTKMTIFGDLRSKLPPLNVQRERGRVEKKGKMD